RRAHRSGATSSSTIVAGRIRALTAPPPITPTSTRCSSAWQPNPGRRSTYRRGKAVQTTGATSQDTIAPGTKLSVLVGQGQKGRQINKMLAIDDSGAAKAPALTAARTQPRRSAPDLAAAIDMVGTVKWFSVAKGMGF